MITEDYVSFETAKLLKEKGFNEPIEMLIREDGTRYHADTNSVSRKRHIMLRNSEINMYSTDLSCPTLQMAMKWLREVHNLFIEIYFDTADMYCDASIYGLNNERKKKIKEFPTYEEACETAIKYCLENLI